MYKKTSKKRTDSIVTAVCILLIAGSVYFTWQNYRSNNPPYSPEISAVLLMAGDNRTELEKTLEHYSRNPADSLKLRAAGFLIANMPGKYSLDYGLPDDTVVAIFRRMTDIADKPSYAEIHRLANPRIREDVKCITAGYLIGNIDLAFAVWKEQPWGKNVSFDIFCETVLPYRVANEPLENWREKVLEKFAGLNRSFKSQPDMTAAQACAMLNSQLPHFRLAEGAPAMNYSMLTGALRGMCGELSALPLFAMRALGIPVVQENTPAWPGRDIGHVWNAVYDSVGKWIPFMGTEFNPGHVNNTLRLPKSKVYRQTFAIQKNIIADSDDIPPSLRNQCVRDVTGEYGEYFKISGVEIPVNCPPAGTSGYAYLAAAGSSQWNITGWGKIGNSGIRFGAVGKNILHLPVFYEDNTQTPAGYPFLVDDTGNLRIFEPDTATNNYRPLTLLAMIPYSKTLINRMVGGIFEGANKSDFSDARMLDSITETDGAYRFNTRTVRNSARFRYIRYVSPKNSWCNVAEIEFYNTAGEKIEGKPVGTQGAFRDSQMTHDKVFDGDVSTYFEAKERTGAWTGLELGKPQTLGKIRYIPCDDGNNINEGQTYELYYWNSNDWKLFERQTATDYFLHFGGVPANALFHIKNTTTNRSGRRFIMNEKGEPQWM